MTYYERRVSCHYLTPFVTKWLSSARWLHKLHFSKWPGIEEAKRWNRLFIVWCLCVCVESWNWSLNQSLGEISNRCHGTSDKRPPQMRLCLFVFTQKAKMYFTPRWTAAIYPSTSNQLLLLDQSVILFLLLPLQKWHSAWLIGQCCCSNNTGASDHTAFSERSCASFFSNAACRIRR